MQHAGGRHKRGIGNPSSNPRIRLLLSTAVYPASGIYNELLANGIMIPALTQLSPLLIFLIIVAYIVIIAPLTYIILKRRGTLDLAWVTIPVTALIVTVVLIASNWVIRGDSTLAYELVVVHQDGQSADAISTSSTAIYTPQRQRITLRNPAGRHPHRAQRSHQCYRWPK